MLKLYTKRLLLRPFEVIDAEPLLALNQDFEVLKYTGDTPFKDLEEVKDFLKSYNQFTKFKMGRFSVIEKASNTYLGWCGLKLNETSMEIDLGFRFFKKYWNQGFATEASIACLNYGFNQLDCKKIIGRAMKENKASIKVLEKVGMQFEKEIEFEGAQGVQYQISKP